MRQFRPTWTLMDQLVLIATTALILAWLGLEGVIASVAMAIPVGLLAAFTSPGRRLAVAAWASIVLAPALLVALHYVAWLAMYFEIGHRPESI